MDKLEAALELAPSLTELVNEQGVSLLLMAAYYRNKEAISVIRKFRKYLSPWEAACLGETEQLKGLLENDPSLLNRPSPDGFSLLGYACFFSQYKTATMLLAKGAAINEPSWNSMKVTPLHSAASSSDYLLCKLLLENGAAINAVQQGGYTALHAAAQNGHTELAKLFLEQGADKTMLTDKGQSAVMLATEKIHTATAKLIAEF